MKKLLWCTALCFTSMMVQAQTTVELNPEKDNSIYDESENSNGLGQLYAGKTCDELTRRALIEFDIAAMVPAGATITDVTLTLNVDEVDDLAADADFSLHRLVTEWGEGASSGAETGAAAVAPDATWSNNMFDTEDWMDAGGDFVEDASATTTLTAALGDFTWSSATMVSNVQNWLDYPGSNHGWILLGDEEGTCNDRRFGSADAGEAPVLEITYTCDGGDPVAVCQSLMVYLNDAGEATIADSDLDGGSFVPCDEEITFTASQTMFTCEDILDEVEPEPSLVITAVYDVTLPGGTPKGVEVYAINSIADLSIYGIGFAQNGGGTDGEEFTFPAVSVGSGTHIYVSFEAFRFPQWFGFDPDYVTGTASINGDDAIELFMDGEVIDLFGDVDVDGSGQPWEYLDGWAYRVSGTGPTATFDLAEWTFSSPNALDGESTNATADTPIPVGTYFQAPTTGLTVNLVVTDADLNEDECVATITVLDTLPPVVACAAMTLVLDETGTVTIDASDVDGGTEDGCGVDEMTISMSTFTCENEGENEVMLYATDIYGNMDSCMAIITIDASEVLTIIGVTTNPSCFGFDDGSIDITVDGGSGDYAYDWDNDELDDFDDTEDLSLIPAGAYQVIVQDENGCQGTVSFELEDPEEITVETEITNESCPGAGDGEIVIIVSGGTPPYTGADDMTDLNAGDYSITVTDANGCSGVAEATVDVDFEIDLTITESGIELTSNEADAEATYQWLSCPDFTPIDGATDQSFTPTEAGSYAVMISIGDGCVDTTECVEVVFDFESIDESNLLDALIYPNPTNGAIYIQVNEQLQSYQVTVTDIKGSVLFEKRMTDNIGSFDLSEVSNGIYFVQLKSADAVLTKKITVSK